MVLTAYFFLGILLGVLLAVSQAWTLRRMDPNAPQRTYLWVFLGFVLRTLLAVAFLFAAALSGLLPVLLGLAGILIGRWSVLLIYS